MEANGRLYYSIRLGHKTPILTRHTLRNFRRSQNNFDTEKEKTLNTSFLQKQFRLDMDCHLMLLKYKHRIIILKIDMSLRKLKINIV
jgi:hypothetical protein